MPNRIIKESIKHSDQIDALSWFEEVLFYRLIVTVDDYGCYDGRVVLLKNELFPTKEDIKKTDIEKALAKMENLGLIQRYSVEGHPYIYMRTWGKHQRVRDSIRKYPEPPEISDSANLRQVAASCGELPQDAEDCGLNPIQSNKESNPNPNPMRAAARDEVEESALSEPVKEKLKEWLEYKRERREAYKPMGLKSLVAQTIKAEQEYGASAVIDGINRAMSNGWKGMNLDLIRGKPPDKSDDVLMRIIQEGA